MKYLTCFAVGFLSSKLLYAPTHSNSFPEVGRYAIGICTVSLAMGLGGVDAREVERVLLLGGAVGAGVAIARVTK